MPKSRQLFVGGYFLLLIAVGLFLYKDYGVSWDESIDRVNGLVNAKYILEHVAPDWTANQPIFDYVPDFYTYLENDHGPIFHLPLAFWEVARGGVESRVYYHVRHLCIFLTFVLGVWALYKLGDTRFKNWQLGLLGGTLLVLSPRLFADAFYNGKDLVFTGVFTLGIYTLVRLLQRPTVAWAVLHGLISAIATDMRILGCLLVAFTLGMLVLEGIFGPPQKPRIRLALMALAYCAAMAVFTVAGWPYLWEQPVESFLQAFENMRQFRWEGYVFYLGEKVSALDLPWHYVPVWIIITTPIAYTLAFATGFLAYCYTLLRQGLAHLRTFEGRLDLLFVGWFFLPILMVIFLHSVIYDGWRHLYFVYPACLLLALRGGYTIWKSVRPNTVGYRLVLGLAMVAAGETAFTLVRMVTAHPNQQVFFSFLPAYEAERLFERDYWGISYHQGLEWILAHDSSAVLPVNLQDPILLENGTAFMDPQTKARFQFTAPGSKGYFVTNYRTHPAPYLPEEQVGWEVYTVYANGIKVLSVFHKP